MFFVYVIRNMTSGRHYTGYTAEVTQRLGQHNCGVTKSTKNRGSWELIYQEPLATRGEAMKRERFLKSGRGREELRQRLAKPSG